MHFCDIQYDKEIERLQNELNQEKQVNLTREALIKNQHENEIKKMKRNHNDIVRNLQNTISQLRQTCIQLETEMDSLKQQQQMQQADSKKEKEMKNKQIMELNNIAIQKKNMERFTKYNAIVKEKTSLAKKSVSNVNNACESFFKQNILFFLGLHVFCFVICFFRLCAANSYLANNVYVLLSKTNKQTQKNKKILCCVVNLSINQMNLQN